MPWQKIFEQTRGDFFLVLPEAMLVFFGLAILLSDFLLTKSQKSWNALTARRTPRRRLGRRRDSTIPSGSIRFLFSSAFFSSRPRRW
jgi:hypothetical protein